MESAYRESRGGLSSEGLCVRYVAPEEAARRHRLRARRRFARRAGLGMAGAAMAAGLAWGAWWVWAPRGTAAVATQPRNTLPPATAKEVLRAGRKDTRSGSGESAAANRVAPDLVRNRPRQLPAPKKTGAATRGPGRSDNEPQRSVERPVAQPAMPADEKRAESPELRRPAAVFGGESGSVRAPVSSITPGTQTGPPVRSTEGPLQYGPRRNDEVARPAATYSGPGQGQVIGSGRIEKDQEVRIVGANVSHGTIHGALPGVPVTIEVNSPDIGITDPPGPDNGWRAVSFRSKKGRHLAVVITWAVNP